MMADIETLARMESQETYGQGRYNISRMVENMDRSTPLDRAFREPLIVGTKTETDETTEAEKEL